MWVKYYSEMVRDYRLYLVDSELWNYLTSELVSRGENF